MDILATWAWGVDIWSRPRLTGSWGGRRDGLGKKGVVRDVDLLQTFQGVASGGRNAVAPYLGAAEYTRNVNTQKLGLWPGGPCGATPVALAAGGVRTTSGVNER